MNKHPADQARDGHAAAGHGPLPPGISGASERSLVLVDDEVRRIVKQSRTEMLAFLRENRGRLDALAGTTGKLKWYFQAVPDDFHDWDMQLSPIYAEAGGRKLIVDAGKMGYVYAMDAATGKLVWKTKVGIHNGHDEDGTLALQHRLGKLRYPLTVEPGIVGGVETNMAVAAGVVFVPIANLASVWKTPGTGLGDANFGRGTGEMLALDLATGRILWDTRRK